MNENKNQRGSVESTDVQSEKIRYGAPDGPRKKRRQTFDGWDPLEYPGHEAVAQFLSTPQSLREFKSFEDLARHFQVTRMTVHRWKQDADVIQRAYCLTMRNQMAGDLLARQEWPQIMKRAVEKAKRGDLQAIKFCESRAWPQELRIERSHLNASLSIENLLGTDERDEVSELPDGSQAPEGGDR